MKNLKIIQPDDFHVHFREGEILKYLVNETGRVFKRAIIMPNLTKPILNEKDVVNYKNQILKFSKKINVIPLMTIYLTEKTKIKELVRAYKEKKFFAIKLYPSGATTNSEFGVKSITSIYPILEEMSLNNIPLLIHGEVNNSKIDIFDREQIFIDEILKNICLNFPELKITLEHITTKYAVDFILSASENVKASITPHHLIYNRSHMLAHKIKPHLYCLPILKKEEDRKSLLKVALNGHKKFFLGTDSAPHDISDKETECGCAGVFNTINCVETLTQLFDDNNKIKNLEKFISINGAQHYSLKQNQSKIYLKKMTSPIKFEKYLKTKNHKFMIFKPPFQVFWKTIF